MNHLVRKQKAWIVCICSTYLFILITQARLCFRMMYLVYSAELRFTVSIQLLKASLDQIYGIFNSAIYYGLMLPVRLEPTAYFTLNCEAHV